MAEKGSIRSRVQKFGSNLSSMIMPNIGAFIAWGLLTAIAVPSGIELFESFVSPMITYLLPLLIAFAGGRLVHDFRGGVVGATAAMGVIVAADMPMFIGAMIMGPLGGYVIKKFDQVMEGKIKQGFEMLVNNFSAGILGAALALFGSLAIGPLVAAFTQVLETGVDAMISWGVLPLVSIFIEPAKILFLNNAINHGVIGPIAAGQVAEYGKSILYLLEANPGPGMGILLAYMIFGKGASRASSYGAGIIHFFGGIHEIYFPYVLMKPLLIVAAILGGAGGIFTLSLFNAGLVSVPSPGSIISILLLTASDSYVGVILSVLVATAISFVVASMILKFDRKGEEENLEEAQGKIKEMKGKTTAAAEPEKTAGVDYGKVSSIIFACDAGMGSSAMGASIMKDRVKKAGLEGISVANTAISNIPDSADLIITHKDLTERAKQKQPNALHVSVDNFMNSPRYQEIIEKLQEAHAQEEQQPTDKPIEKIVFACDAGMGSSAMGASLLKDKFKKAGITGIHVSNTAVSNIPADADLVITHKDLTERAKQKQPDAEHLSVENFLSSPRYDELVERLK
ncbi:PTS mannitol-specific transporter subunit IIBC [Shouchella clausii]|uniref:PTS system mannitol-specific EIICB component n=2 Tax=Shouchella TaxID=2893057 RepID=Q5WDU7_SHOC1|nr:MULTISPECIES: PTS mannitol-specific transporter subunit IIBC [Shouchella]MCM3313667.1 PTS mannitol-specific transporter subunit IIBC [Psychrobacillus sp. MER TA 17]ALA54203.1 PTS system, mannitol-specific IIB component [Shouchella clausii]MBU3229251.1 PTS mannitol transporter subunit IICBA [Shouchella clausii]MBU3265527.1 PTS mannitol transporter subunit IICBA [Shouchella clausii]MBU3506151.1 PTS mannitol transporter subunit IICBA [Shouchella clausii]